MNMYTLMENKCTKGQPILKAVPKELDKDYKTIIFLNAKQPDKDTIVQYKKNNKISKKWYLTSFF